MNVFAVRGTWEHRVPLKPTRDILGMGYRKMEFLFDYQSCGHQSKKRSPLVSFEGNEQICGYTLSRIRSRRIRRLIDVVVLKMRTRSILFAVISRT